MSGATNWSKLPLEPITITAYPNPEPRVYHPSSARGILGFSRVIVRWDEDGPNMYQWQPRQPYSLRWPGQYVLLSPPGKPLLYHPIIDLNLTYLYEYLYNYSYKRTIEYPEKVEKEGKVDWNYDFVIKDDVTRENAAIIDDSLEPPINPTLNTEFIPSIVPVPRCWSKSELSLKIAEDAPFHDDSYVATYVQFGLKLLPIPLPELIEFDFDGEIHHETSLVDRTSILPGPRMTKGLYGGIHLSMEVIDVHPHASWGEPLVSDFYYSLASTVLVNPGSGLAVIHRDNGNTILDFYWNPSSDSPRAIQVDDGYYHNGVGYGSSSYAYYNILATPRRNVISLVCPVDSFGHSSACLHSISFN